MPKTSEEKTTEAFSLEQRFQASLDFVKFICVFGSSNKMEDIEKTGGWVLRQRYHFYSTTGWYERYANEDAFEDNLQANLLYDVKRKKLIEDVRKRNPSEANEEPGWYYHVKDFKTVEDLDNHDLFCKTTLDPLTDTKFDLERDIEKLRLLRSIVRTIESRYGNCYAKAALVTDYLWRRPLGIERLEGFSMASFDHTFVVVNRKQGSKSNDSTTWGDDCWVIDPWYNSFYPAREFQEQINKIKLFGDQQDDALVKSGFEVKQHSKMDAALVEEILWDLNPQVDLYPTYDKQMGIYDYYTFHNIEYDAVDKAEHRTAFQNCLVGKNSVTDPDIRNKFFKNKSAADETKEETNKENNQEQPDPLPKKNPSKSG